MKWTIPIDFKVLETTETKAEQEVFNFLVRATKEFGNEYNIIDWHYTDFGEAMPESSNS